MSKHRSRGLPVLAVIGLLAGTFVACDTQQQQDTNPVTMAYRMMDQGQNDRAAVVLEQYVAEHPDDIEAKVMLASSYLGQAGINIYKIHDEFQDVLFNKPLSDTFFGSGSAAISNPFGNDTDLNGTVADAPQGQKGRAEAALSPMEQNINNLDLLLDKSQKVLEFLNRFPDVPPGQWPLLDRAQTLLESSGDEKDICLYRLFFRVIYVKAYIAHKLLRNGNVGRHEWLCSMDLDALRDDVDWLIGQLQKSSQDFQLIFPGKSSNMNSVGMIAAAFQESVDQITALSDQESLLGKDSFEGQFKAALSCGTGETGSSGDASAP